MAMRWTKEEDRRLSELWPSELDGTQLAAKLSAEFGRYVSRAAVSRHAARIKLPHRSWGLGLAWIDSNRQHQGDNCLIWPFGKLSSGHPATVRVDGVETLAHRVMCERRNGPPPSPAHEAAHNCGKGHNGCIHPGHLRWATHSENMLDRALHGTDNRGEKHSSARLTREDVLAIRSMKGVKTDVSIAAEYGITPQYVGTIHARKKWAWLP